MTVDHSPTITAMLEAAFAALNQRREITVTKAKKVA